MDECELVRQLKAQNPDALKVLRARCERQVLALLLQALRNAQDAEEAFGDVLLKVWNAIGRYDERRDGGLAPWVRTIALNHARNMLRQQRRQRQELPPPLCLEAAGEAAAPPQVGSGAEAEEDQPSLWGVVSSDALGRLPQRYQDLLTLFAAGCSPKQIAELTGIPSVSVKLNQAAAALVREIGRDERTAASGLDLPHPTQILGNLRELRDLRNLHQETEQHSSPPSRH